MTSRAKKQQSVVESNDQVVSNKSDKVKTTNKSNKDKAATPKVVASKVKKESSEKKTESTSASFMKNQHTKFNNYFVSLYQGNLSLLGKKSKDDDLDSLTDHDMKLLNENRESKLKAYRQSYVTFIRKWVSKKNTTVLSKAADKEQATAHVNTVMSTLPTTSDNRFVDYVKLKNVNSMPSGLQVAEKDVNKSKEFKDYKTMVTTALNKHYTDNNAPDKLNGKYVSAVVPSNTNYNYNKWFDSYWSLLNTPLTKDSLKDEKTRVFASKLVKSNSVKLCGTEYIAMTVQYLLEAFVGACLNLSSVTDGVKLTDFKVAGSNESCFQPDTVKVDDPVVNAVLALWNRRDTLPTLVSNVDSKSVHSGLLSLIKETVRSVWATKTSKVELTGLTDKQSTAKELLTLTEGLVCEVMRHAVIYQNASGKDVTHKVVKQCFQHVSDSFGSVYDKAESHVNSVNAQKVNKKTIVTE